MARLIMTEEELLMSPEEWKDYIRGNEEVKKRIEAYSDTLESYGEDGEKYLQTLAERTYEKTNKAWNRDRVKMTNNSQTLERARLDAGTGNAAVYYTSLVQNLSLYNFGICNCDQVYRIKNQIAIKAILLDEKGNKVSGYSNFQLVDPSINASFYANPEKITVNRKAANILICFGENNRFYMITGDKWKEMKINTSGTYTFRMIDVSDKVRTTDDLQKLIRGRESS